LSDARVSDSLRRALSRECRGVFLDTPETTRPFSADFGGIFTRQPQLVLKPLALADLATALHLAATHGVAVTTRGAGHSQSGQSLGSGIVLDLRDIGGTPVIDRNTETLEIGAGLSWRSATDFTFSKGFIPRALTHMLDATVAGTLSVGGIGSESWRFGPQVDNVRWLDVMTVDGEVLRCSTSLRPELFDAVRSGFGQCGIIVRVGYPLRRCAGLLRTRTLVYRDAAAFHHDVDVVTADTRQERFLSGAVVRDPLGSIERRFLLRVGRDFNELADLETDVLPELHADLELPPRHTRLWRQDGLPGHVFFQTFPRSQVVADAGELHPWVDHLFRHDLAKDVVEVLRASPHRALDYGTLGLIFVRRGTARAPFFILPDESELTWEVGMFSSFAPKAHALGLSVRQEFVDLLRPFGGKRYLSSFRPFDWLACPDHYGPMWASFVSAKRRFDPRGTLNPGFIEWPEQHGGC